MKEEKIFHEALEKPLGMREEFVDSACSEDADLCRRVKKLLQAHENTAGFLKQPAFGPSDLQSLPPLPDSADSITAKLIGSQIGPYVLREQIGEGGMGVVYVAEQEKPVRRKVALKIIKPGMDSKQIIARFEAERQALALMDHPNIASVYQAGATEQGRPYFVMELVHGFPITEYCDKHQLGTRDRLELFITICRAVQHAHGKGIIHRDLKPSNILVTQIDGMGVAKVIDFGVAKATNGQLTDQSIYTHFSQLVGTPLYMSPEQAELSDGDIDVRSDVYSLGVLLYELLTGRTPIDKEVMKQASDLELRRIIREDEPRLPSQRISTLKAEANSTASEPSEGRIRKFDITTRGELDWLVMKALDKDRNRRYESTSAFADDVQRYLSDEPVLACPPGITYRFLKFARRNKGVLLAQVIIALSLLVVIPMQLAGIFSANWRREFVTTSGKANRENTHHVLQLDGHGSHVFLPGLYYDGDHPVTLEAWVKPESLSTATSILADFQKGTIGLELRSGKYEFSIRDGNSYRRATSAPVSLGEAVHVAGVFDGTETRLYVDGELQNEPTPFNGQPNPSAVQPMTDANPEGKGFIHKFVGWIDEVRISSTARYTESFIPQRRFEPDEQTISLYHFDEGEGDIAHDSSNNHRHGRIWGAEWLASQFEPSDAREALVAIAKMGGTATRQNGRVTKVLLSNSEVTDVELEGLKKLTQLEELELDNTQVSNIGLAHLRRLTQLKILTLRGTQVGDAGMASLKEMTQLEVLNLADTSITDAGLVHLQGLAKLRDLELLNTYVTDEGLVHLRGLTELSRIGLSTSTNLTEVGLGHLKAITSLAIVTFRDSQITVAGLKHLRELTPSKRLNSVSSNNPPIEAEANETAPGNWTQDRFGAQKTSYNPHEREIGPSNVGELKLVWSNAHFQSLRAGVLVDGDIAYYADYAGEFRAVEAATGKTVWSQRLPGKHSGKAVVDNVVYVSSIKQLFAFDATSGRTFWTKDVTSGRFGSLFVANRILYVTSGSPPELHAIDVATGEEFWSAPTGQYAISKNVLFDVTADTLRAINSRTGEVLWEIAIEVGVTGAPAISDGVIYLHSAKGKLYAYDATEQKPRSAKPLWVGRTAAIEKGDGPQSPAVAEGMVFVGVNNTFYAFDTTVGPRLERAPTWTAAVDVPYFPNYPPSVANGVVYSAAGNHHIYAFDAEKGTVLWNFHSKGTEYPMRSSPTIADGRLYHVATFAFTLYAFELPRQEESSGEQR